MLFATVYTLTGDGTEEKQKRVLQLFTNWKVPEGFEFKAHYARADGNGGIAIVEASSVAALLEGIAPWAPFFHFETSAVMDIMDAVPILMRVNAWRDSVG
jgi:Protein of unknown function (DUF3303)